MQVEGSEKPSDGRLTTSLIAPITLASPLKSSEIIRNVPPKIVGVHPPISSNAFLPKFVLLGSQQDANGAVSYRIGISFPLNQKVNLRELSRSLGLPLANGQIPIVRNSEHLHAFISTKDDHGNRYQTHLVIEDKKDGLVAADIAAVNGDQTAGSIQGFISSPYQSQVVKFEPGRPYVVILNDSDSQPKLVDLGTIEHFEIEVGSIGRTSQDFVVKRSGSELKIFSRESGDDLNDPFGEHPIATLAQSGISARFPGSHASLRLSSEIAAGNVFVATQPQQPLTPFGVQNSSGSGRSL